MSKTLSEQLDELHEKVSPDNPSEKCEHGYEANKCVLCALIASRNRVRTNADFDREKREYHKIQRYNNLSGFGKSGDIFRRSRKNE